MKNLYRLNILVLFSSLVVVMLFITHPPLDYLKFVENSGHRIIPFAKSTGYSITKDYITALSLSIVIGAVLLLWSFMKKIESV